MRYNWEVQRTTFDLLERLLETASANGWEVFSVLNVDAAFVVIFRRPVP